MAISNVANATQVQQLIVARRVRHEPRKLFGCALLQFVGSSEIRQRFGMTAAKSFLRRRGHWIFWIFLPLSFYRFHLRG